MASQPGNASTSPFGNGGGNTDGSGGMPNDFTANPSGGGSKGGRGQPESYGASRPQRSGTDPTSSGDAAVGPKTAAEVVTPGGGVGSIGNPARPMKLGGG